MASAALPQRQAKAFDLASSMRAQLLQARRRHEQEQQAQQQAASCGLAAHKRPQADAAPPAKRQRLCAARAGSAPSTACAVTAARSLEAAVAGPAAWPSTHEACCTELPADRTLQGQPAPGGLAAAVLAHVLQGRALAVAGQGPQRAWAGQAGREGTPEQWQAACGGGSAGRGAAVVPAQALGNTRVSAGPCGGLLPLLEAWGGGNSCAPSGEDLWTASQSRTPLPRLQGPVARGRHAPAASGKKVRCLAAHATPCS